MKIVVIGAGIVGLATAYWLARDGHSVEVVDKAPEVGQGASFANGGQLSYSYVAPLAGPSVLRDLPGWLLSRNSPIRFRLALEMRQLVWLLSFLKACSDKRSRITTELLLSLAELSRVSLNEIVAREAIAFAHRRNGKIIFYSSRASFDAARRQHALQAELGSAQSVLGAEECLALEPALAPAAHRLVGAVYTPSEEAGDCHLLCRELRRILEAPPYDVRFTLGAEVRRLVGTDRRIESVELATGRIGADLYVICAGSDSYRLLRTLGLDIPLYPIRGYSISAPVIDPARVPENSITDYQNRIVYARLGGILRVAGFADLVPVTAPMDEDRLAALDMAVNTLFPGGCAPTGRQVWAGARPATPTGLPVIGPTRWTNLLLNIGHGALGFTLGAGSGRLLADILAGRRAGVDEHAFALPALRHGALAHRAAA